ncbi:MAG: hypothetical protein PGN25_04135 [Methylorubrum populi]
MIRVFTTAAILAVGILTAALSSARSEAGVGIPGPARGAIERWFSRGGGPVCTDATGSDTVCDLGRLLAMQVKYDAGVGQALAFATYSPAVGNATSLVVAQFRRGERGWALVRTLSGVYGEGPDIVSFQGGKATFVMNALMPGDARCCLSGKQRYAVDLATGAVTAGPKTPGAGTPASESRRFAPRPEGYEGASYDHNGSRVLVDERAGTIRYDVPKASMRTVAARGTLLFHGTFAANGAITGTAYAFKAGCEPAPYTVTGRSQSSTIVLRGPAPKRDPLSCAVTGVADGGALVVLTFREYGDL